MKPVWFDLRCLALAAVMATTVCHAETVAQYEELKLGDAYSGVVAIGDGSATKQVVLPAGQWRLIQKGEGTTAGAQGGRQDGRKFKEEALVFVQTEGRNLRALLQVLGTAEFATGVEWRDEPCKRTNTLYRNAFDSSPWTQTCLLVNHVVGSLSLAPTTRQTLKTIGIPLPTAALVSQLTRYQRGGFLQLSVFTNPAFWGIDSLPQAWNASAWHKDNIAGDPVRLSFARQWEQWSESYAGLLDSEFKGTVVSTSGSASDFPAFSFTPS